MRQEITLEDGETHIIKIELPNGDYLYVNGNGEDSLTVDLQSERGKHLGEIYHDY